MTTTQKSQLLVNITRSLCRPVTLIITFLVLWTLLFVVYFRKDNLLTLRPKGSFSKGKNGMQEQSDHAAHQANEETALNHNSDSSHHALSTHDNDVIKKTPSDDSQLSAPKIAEADEQFRAEEEQFAQRRKMYEKACQAGHNSGPVFEVYYYEPAKLSVCHVQKVGCTFWKRIFHFLYNETNSSNISSPFQIDRFYVHFGTRRKTKVAAYLPHKALIDTHSKVLFSRDPWTRVWSSFIDKLVLPDSWLDHGKNILLRRHRQNGARVTSHTCPDDVSFAEFLDYAMSKQDAHWKPVHLLCNPCVFKPKYVGQMESFSKDSAHILRKVGLSSLVQGHQTQAAHAEDEVRMLSEYHFRLFETRPGLRKCLQYSGVAERLWKAFVLNGYISANISFPKEEFSQLNTLRKSDQVSHKATELLLKYHLTSPPLTSAQMKQHRRRIMAQHYRQASRDLLEKMVATFNGDFALFGYDARPSDIFTS